MNKKQNCFSLADHLLAESVILVFGFYETIESDKNELATKFVGIKVTIIFI